MLDCPTSLVTPRHGAFLQTGDFLRCETGGASVPDNRLLPYTRMHAHTARPRLRYSQQHVLNAGRCRARFPIGRMRNPPGPVLAMVCRIRLSCKLPGRFPLAAGCSRIRSRNSYSVPRVLAVSIRSMLGRQCTPGPNTSALPVLATETSQLPSGSRPECLRQWGGFPFPYSSDQRTSFVLSPSLGVSSEAPVPTDLYFVRWGVHDALSDPKARRQAGARPRRPFDAALGAIYTTQTAAGENDTRRGEMGYIHGLWQTHTSGLVDCSPRMRTGNIGEDLDASATMRVSVELGNT